MELCRISFIRTLNPSYPWGLHLHDVITSQRPHCILPSQWTFKLQLVNFGGAQTFRPKHLKDARDALGNWRSGCPNFNSSSTQKLSHHQHIVFLLTVGSFWESVIFFCSAEDWLSMLISLHGNTWLAILSEFIYYSCLRKSNLTFYHLKSTEGSGCLSLSQGPSHHILCQL